MKEEERIRELKSHLLTIAPHTHICNGERPGGHFYQYESQQVWMDVLDGVARIVYQINKGEKEI